VPVSHDPTKTNHVGCRLNFTAIEPSVLALAVAVSDRSGERVSEVLHLVDDDGGAVPVAEIATTHGGRIHLAQLPSGPIHLDYSATIERAHAPSEQPGSVDMDTIVALRQSRYCPSDALEGFAHSTFVAPASRADRAREISSWVFERIRYEPGSSGPLDTAIDTLLESQGVCRDFSHLMLALCRAVGIPARLAAVYAPGLNPMDFHAVVEVLTEHGWEVLDPTRLAPRQSLVRIATGRDAADTAFATTISGDVALDTAEIIAVVDGDLPTDDHLSVVALA
jgi:hypothetical protein